MSTDPTTYMNNNPTTRSSPVSTPSSSTPSSADGTTGRKSFLWVTVVTWLVLIGASAGAWHYQQEWLPRLKAYFAAKPATTKAPPIVPVSTAVVRQRDLPLYLNGLGTVTAFKSVTIRSRVEGELITIAFTEGQMVYEGDLLAEIDPRPFKVQLAQAEGLLARDQATLKTAMSTFSRYEGLLASKSIAAQQVDEQGSIVQQTLASIQTDEAMIANAKLQLTYSKITAPISGRIGLRLVDQGNIVRANDPNGLAVITQLQPIALLFTIPQDDIGRVQRRSLAKEPLKVVAFDRDFKQKLATGHLLAIDNQVDATTGTVRLKAKFDNDDGMLFPQQFVNAQLLVDTKPNAIVVPSSAVQRGPAGMYVYVVKSDDTVEQRIVVPGPAEGAETSIESGLAAGETVVTDGLDKLRPGGKIAPRDPSKDGGKKGGADKGSGDKAGGGQEGNKKSETKTAPSNTPDPQRSTAAQGSDQPPKQPIPGVGGDSKPKGSSCDETEAGAGSPEASGQDAP